MKIVLVYHNLISQIVIKYEGWYGHLPTDRESYKQELVI